MARTVNASGLALIRMFEGCRLVAYRCEAGRLTIGFGHTEAVTEGMRITKAEAERLLVSDVATFANAVERLVRAKLDENQFAALVSLAFNIGVGNFASSTLLRMLNLGDYKEAAEQFLVWNKVRSEEGLVVSKVLKNRRKVERLLFLGKVASLDDVA